VVGGRDARVATEVRDLSRVGLRVEDELALIGGPDREVGGLGCAVGPDGCHDGVSLGTHVRDQLCSIHGPSVGDAVAAWTRYCVETGQDSRSGGPASPVA